MNRKYKYHPFLSANYLTRKPINHCMKCGRNLGNIRPDFKNIDKAWVYDAQMDIVHFIGYCHQVCPDDKKGDNDYSMVNQ